ncbi:hypothetical protein ACFQO9_01220 [Chryseobacterium zhengzhouense]|uniref:Uncharacterized protein n=1 Tax=Chryseobacterium zhengzhouense TaxID=1636086 RepID=A0ABW2LUZ6_9FLAO
MESFEQSKDLIEYYLALSIKQQFNIDLDLKDEFTFTENIVSKKMIIAPTFSDRILKDSEIKDFLHALISDINNEVQQDIVNRSDSEPLRNIV